jgi:hypothetical protein
VLNVGSAVHAYPRVRVYDRRSRPGKERVRRERSGESGFVISSDPTPYESNKECDAK